LFGKRTFGASNLGGCGLRWPRPDFDDCPLLPRLEVFGQGLSQQQPALGEEQEDEAGQGENKGSWRLRAEVGE
jgi:hypothetical protein